MTMNRKLPPIPPGEILAEEYLTPLGISQNQLARDIDVPVSRVAGIVNGSRAITADTALRFGKYFGTSPDIWMNLQAHYDLQVAMTSTWPNIKDRIRPHSASSKSTPSR